MIKKEIQNNHIKKIIIFFVLCFFNNINKTPKYYLFNEFTTNKKVKLFNLNYTKEQYKLKGLDFLNKLKKSKLNKISKQINKPKISVLIPIYNCEKTIERTIRSIQNQNYNHNERNKNDMCALPGTYQYGNPVFVLNKDDFSK